MEITIVQFWTAFKLPLMVSPFRDDFKARLFSIRKTHLRTRANATRAHINETLGWQILPQPPYSTDIAPSDYHLFRSIKNHLREVRSLNDTQIKNWVTDLLEAKSATAFYRRRILELPKNWQEVIDNNGQ